jgi:hypothetical protein
MVWMAGFMVKWLLWLGISAILTIPAITMIPAFYLGILITVPPTPVAPPSFPWNLWSPSYYFGKNQKYDLTFLWFSVCLMTT